MQRKVISNIQYLRLLAASGILISHTASRGDIAMLMIAHNLQHIFSVCSRVHYLRRGSLVADASRL